MKGWEEMIRSTATRVAVGLSVGLCLAASPVWAQDCPGDCDGDGTVTISELIRAVNISLGSQPLSNCMAADTSGDGSVAINELIQAVNASLMGCPPPVNTPTPTASPTVPPSENCGDGIIDDGEECDDGKTCGVLGDACEDDNECREGVSCTPRDGDGCQANCLLPVCGDGIVDNLTEGETCDDGDDSDECVASSIQCCPSDCTIAECSPTENRLEVNVDFDTDLFITGLTLFVQYPDGIVSIPSSGNTAAVRERVTSSTFPPPTVNDRNYGLTALLTDIFGVGEGTAMTISFDTCAEAGAPSAEDFSCIVQDATDDNFTTVTEQVSCSVSIQ
jgi:hypothetical protein